MATQENFHRPFHLNSDDDAVCIVVNMAVVEEFSREPERLTKELLQQPLVLFNPHRIAIMLELYHAGVAEFPQLRHDLGLTDGALATHLKALGGEGLIEARREQVGPRTRTAYIITRGGISAVDRMFSTMCEIKERLQ
jgi:DNA-binding MarR family transcriptional regulator